MDSSLAGYFVSCKSIGFKNQWSQTEVVGWNTNEYFVLELARIAAKVIAGGARLT